MTGGLQPGDCGKAWMRSLRETGRRLRVAKNDGPEGGDCVCGAPQVSRSGCEGFFTGGDTGEDRKDGAYAVRPESVCTCPNAAGQRYHGDVVTLSDAGHADG